MNDFNPKIGQTDSLNDSSPDVVEDQASLPDRASVEGPDLDAVVRELPLILGSSFFRSSKRSQQFLNYVVQYRLDGHLEPLKERTIGSDLFNRPAGYATGDDSVVRVQAGEVRRRLEQYYQAPPSESRVRIELPLGSYAPEFRWSANAVPHPVPAKNSALAVASRPEPVLPHVQEVEFLAPVPDRRRRNRWIAALSISIILALALAGLLIYRANTPTLALNRFWSPIFASSKPLLICLPKPISYRPSIDLYNRSANTPGEFDSEVDRMNARPHLKPDDKLVWGDMIEYGDLGVGKGDVAAAIRLSSLLGRIGKDSEVRIGNEYSSEDLRTSPAIIIGAFSNRWTMEMTSNLHFAFKEDHAVFSIQEQGPQGRRWYADINRSGQIVVDYGVVTRLVNSSTGQFVVAIAGITSDGSEAAAEIACSPEGLEKALRNAPPDWKHKNVQILVKTSVSDGIAGPAQVVAIYVW
jgi:hypothetical protein